MPVLINIIETLIFFVLNLPVRFGFLDRNRWRLLRLVGVSIQRCEVCAPVSFMQVGKLSHIVIGPGCFINTGLRIDAGSNTEVRIGAKCLIGPYVSLETGGHDVLWQSGKDWGRTERSIIIGDKCWLGTRVVVIGGVTIGEGSVVAAGAVVTKDVEPYTLVGGVPAKLIRRLKT
jgi:maltose O-acetyltransferase